MRLSSQKNLFKVMFDAAIANHFVYVREYELSRTGPYRAALRAGRKYATQHNFSPESRKEVLMIFGSVVCYLEDGPDNWFPDISYVHPYNRNAYHYRTLVMLVTGEIAQ